jgi:hypothetical protein
MVTVGASETVMLEILQRNGVNIRHPRTLRRAFKEELKQGREHLIASLGMKMLRHAMGDGPHSFSALAFLLRTMGGPQWRVPKDEDEDQAAAAASATNDTPTVIILPANGRQPIPSHMQPPPGYVPPPREIEIEATAEPASVETTEPEPDNEDVA